MVDTSGTHRPGPGTERGELPSPCELVTVPARQGLEAVDLLRYGSGVGPVLHDGTGASLGFLVPPGTADGWDVPGSSCTRAAPPAAGGGWLVPPRAETAVTDPAVLRDALGRAARTIELVDGCQGLRAG
ncbi:MAG: hypothetical protein HOY69_37510 [Streptomyces sp.]|nr:hypothetical protein [Streptomyces sp.]